MLSIVSLGAWIVIFAQKHFCYIAFVLYRNVFARYVYPFIFSCRKFSITIVSFGKEKKKKREKIFSNDFKQNCWRRSGIRIKLFFLFIFVFSNFLIFPNFFFERKLKIVEKCPFLCFNFFSCKGQLSIIIVLFCSKFERRTKRKKFLTWYFYISIVQNEKRRKEERKNLNFSLFVLLRVSLKNFLGFWEKTFLQLLFQIFCLIFGKKNSFGKND